MAKTQIKIVVFFFAVSFLAASVLLAAYFVKKEFTTEWKAEEEIAEILRDAPAPPDPGQRDFDEASALLQEGKIADAREVLERMSRNYPDSILVPVARRIIGEINMDRLLSREPMPGKLEYTVRPGDALAAISRKNRTTIEFIQLVNGIQGSTIHPGDRLIVIPFEFEVEARLGSGVLTLFKDGEFFKDYAIEGHALAPGVRVPMRTKVSARSAVRDGEIVRGADANFAAARKSIQCSRPGSRIGLPLASVAKSEGEKNELPYGVFLADKDMEELYLLLREGTIVTFYDD